MRRIDWFLLNKAEKPRMAQVARETVVAYTWDAYCENDADVVKS